MYPGVPRPSEAGAPAQHAPSAVRTDAPPAPAHAALSRAQRARPKCPRSSCCSSPSARNAQARHRCDDRDLTTAAYLACRARVPGRWSLSPAGCRKCPRSRPWPERATEPRRRRRYDASLMLSHPSAPRKFQRNRSDRRPRPSVLGRRRAARLCLRYAHSCPSYSSPARCSCEPTTSVIHRT